MKKLFISILLTVLGVIPLYADTTTVTTLPVTTTTNTYLGDQVTATLLSHGTVFEQYEHGSRQMVLVDNVIEAGSLNKQYVFAAALGLTSALDIETLLRFNVHSIVNHYVTFTPQWDWLRNIEYFPAVGYDWSQNHQHAWIASVNLGIGFGPTAAPVQ